MSRVGRLENEWRAEEKAGRLRNIVSELERSEENERGEGCEVRRERGCGGGSLALWGGRGAAELR